MMYILKDKIPVEASSVLEWGKWFEIDDNRIVDCDSFNMGNGKVTVSTVFLGIDHQWSGGQPILFETMVFGGSLDGSQERCSTWSEAVNMHRRWLFKSKVG